MSFSQGSQSFPGQPAVLKRRFTSLLKRKSSVVAIYIAAFMLVVAIISVGYYSPQESSVVANATKTGSSNPSDQASVDDVVATGVAATVAQSVNLPIATSVTNLAVSAQIRSEFAQTDSVSNSKPQIIGSSYENRSVISYTVKNGDTVASLATKYGISTQTIKWANDLTDRDTISADDVIRILPIDGVLYSVKSGDTIDSISEKYKVDKTRLVGYNDLEVSGLKVNTSIILPNGILPTEERPGYVAPVAAVNYFYAGTGTGFGGQTWYIGTGTGSCPAYAFGNCTCYAFNRRVQLGLPVGGSGGLVQWGHAASWAWIAGQPIERGGGGRVVNNTPSVGAIMQNGGGYGHVAIVEALMPNGDISISEMNAYVSGGGWNIVSGRIVPAGNVGQYLYVH